MHFYKLLCFLSVATNADLNRSQVVGIQSLVIHFYPSATILEDKLLSAYSKEAKVIEAQTLRKHSLAQQMKNSTEAFFYLLR